MRYDHDDSVGHELSKFRGFLGCQRLNRGLLSCGHSKHCRGRHRTSRSLPPSSSHNHASQKSPHSVSFLQTSHPIGCVRLELRHSGICVHAAHYHRSRQKRITGPEHVPAQHTASVTPHSARATAIIHSYCYCWGRAAGYRIPYRVADRETTHTWMSAEN